MNEMSRCGNCDLPNEDVHSFCVSCGAPLWTPTKPAGSIKPPADAVALWSHAMQEWRYALTLGEPDRLFWEHIASLLSLALDYCRGAPFPRAHCHLAIVHLTLGNNTQALSEATIALQEDPQEFRAQQVRVALALDKVRDSNRRSWLASPGMFSRKGSEPAPKAEGKSRGANLERSHGSIERLDLGSEVVRIVDMFNHMCASPLDVGDYLNLADFMICVAEEIKSMRVGDLWVTLVDSVANSLTDKLDCRGKEDEVTQIVQRARLAHRSLDRAPETLRPHRHLQLHRPPWLTQNSV